jgi:hypothetical protein
VAAALSLAIYYYERGEGSREISGETTTEETTTLGPGFLRLESQCCLKVNVGCIFLIDTSIFMCKVILA